jgi:hypothetical protein
MEISRNSPVLPVEVMEPVAIVNELLFTVLTSIDRGQEVPDLGSLTSGTERAEGRVHVARHLPYRTIIDPINYLNSISPRKWCADRMPRLFKDKHAESGKEVVEKAYSGITVIRGGALANHHIPVGFLLRSDQFPHRVEGSLLVPEPYCLVRTEQVLVDLPCQPVPVFRRQFLDFFTKISFHLLDIGRGMPEHEKRNFCPEFPPGISQMEFLACARDLFAGILSIMMIRIGKLKQSHGTGTYLRISDFLP